MILLPREAIWTCAAVFRVLPEEPERGNVHRKAQRYPMRTAIGSPARVYR
jgi:hypothetical protein